MIRIFYIRNGRLQWEKNPEHLLPKEVEKVIWVDLQSPDETEKKTVEAVFKIEFQSPQEIAEIESSSRYYEDHDGIEANSTFVVAENHSFAARQVSFILRGETLFTLRHSDLKSFADTVRKLKTVKSSIVKNGSQIWLYLLEARIDLDADFIENLSRQTNATSRLLTKEKNYAEATLIRITELQENMILIRESITDKQRLVSSLLKSHFVANAENERLQIIIRDINSLLQHTEFGFERLEYLQNTFLGLVNIEQNQVIKIFTVVTVVFMPPTLIASIYGMNFHHMPELSWMVGYPLALGLMVFSSMSFLWYFKKKKWL